MNVSFVIGRNGVGKSQNLIRRAMDNTHGSSIFVCNTVHDRSHVLANTKRFSAKNSASRPGNVIKSVLKKMLKEGSYRLNQIERVLRYCGYSPCISIKVKTGKLDERVQDFTDLPFIKNLVGMMERHFGGGSEREFKVRFDGEYDVPTVSLLEALFYQQKPLRHYGLVKSVEMTLYKIDGQSVPLSDASSGELSLITSMMFILSEAQGANLLLIDEPENSLHPTWQRGYVSTLCSLLDYHEIEVVIATHSPLIVAGAQLDDRVQSTIYHPETGKLDQSLSNNIESLLWDQFDTISPASRFLSERLSQKLDELSKSKISEADALAFIDGANRASFDDSQQDMFAAARKLAISIARG